MDAGIIKSFKSRYNKRFVNAAIRHSEQEVSDIYKLNQLQVTRLATEAWLNVSAETIVNCWRHTSTRLPDPSILAAPSPAPEDNAPITADNLIAQLNLDQRTTNPHAFDVIHALDAELPDREELDFRADYAPTLSRFTITHILICASRLIDNFEVLKLRD
ncbi:hypothetical protein FRC08_013798 [Ceratobasidium sp. 394]|nr:hypothetical protein FRC08_013798 [Ceratobasidium sp. 394]